MREVTINRADTHPGSLGDKANGSIDTGFKEHLRRRLEQGFKTATSVRPEWPIAA